MSHTSKRLKQAEELIDSKKTYTPQEAIELAKKTATTKFRGSIEVHVNLAIDPRMSDQAVRGQVKLPHGTGKVVRVAAFVGEAKEKEAKDAGADLVGGEELIKEIATSGKTNFDVAIATPDMMPKLAQVAKLLGPRGLMPSPRSGTVTPNVAEGIAEIKAGRIDFKNDDSGNLHAVLGKSDLDDAKILENYQAFMEAVLQARPAAVKKQYLKGVALNATMGPGIRVQM